jgi:pyruvate dehydrogenase E1 component
MDMMKSDADPRKPAGSTRWQASSPTRARPCALPDREPDRGRAVPVPAFSANTAYINTIPVDQQVRIPATRDHTGSGRTWLNAMAVVLRANKHERRRPHRELRLPGRCTHRFNHLARSVGCARWDLVFVQGHSTGVCARLLSA